MSRVPPTIFRYDRRSYGSVLSLVKLYLRSRRIIVYTLVYLYTTYSQNISYTGCDTRTSTWAATDCQGGLRMTTDDSRARGRATTGKPRVRKPPPYLPHLIVMIVGSRCRYILAESTTQTDMDMCTLLKQCYPLAIMQDSGLRSGESDTNPITIHNTKQT